LRLYKPSGEGFERIGAPKKIMGGKKPIAARFSPDGSMLAVGFKDSSPTVMVFEVKSLLGAEPLKRLRLANTKGLTGEGHLARVAWSRNGDWLYAGGGFSEGGVHPILCWKVKEDGPATRWRASTDSIMDIWPLKDGRLVFGARNPAFGILDPADRRLRANIPDMADFHNRQKQFRISGDGSMVEFAFGMQHLDLTLGGKSSVPLTPPGLMTRIGKILKNPGSVIETSRLVTRRFPIA
jgi:WD40 repeat protein